jgi:hypothetical protein
MATFLDVSGLAAFSKIFVFLLVLVVIYLAVATSKFGQTKWIAWIVALVVAILVLLSDLATGIIQSIAPWFAVLLIFIVFVAVASKIFGGDVGDIMEFKGVFFVIIVIVFIVGSLMYVRNTVNVPGDKDQDGKVIKDKDYTLTSNFIFHPKVMGVIFVLLIAIFTVALLAGKT